METQIHSFGFNELSLIIKELLDSSDIYFQKATIDKIILTFPKSLLRDVYPSRKAFLKLF